MSLNSDTVKHLSTLCRLHCTEEELHTLTGKLHEILALVRQMQAIDTTQVSPCNHIYDALQTPLRDDDPSPPLERKTFLDNSPSHISGMIRVPSVIKS